ncbi:Crp/Fnr family transcriptional regulator [uncultured Cohaesibacter sp.]|uniref:Crp/Fnr family transcriptional regulator n=1 Tax=uncultured Cohaesibacter sp. TaxID=1002546 RepID=UPI002AAACF8D|nr:Crp/Fnr family transcriptional regulator [uncultured Cohaesibacter sp.]
MKNHKARAERTECEKCPLREIRQFRDFDPDELEFVSNFKKGELHTDPGATILVEGSNNPHIYTVLTGWGFRSKLLEDGRRQILNYIMPGDMIGLQGSIMGEMEHSVEALSAMTLCVFEREYMMNLYEKHPDLGYDVTWIAAREERILDEHLVSVGRRTALERAAYLLAYIHQKATAVGLAQAERSDLAITQQHIADTLGLSIVHTNKTLRKLAQKNLIIWKERGCEVLSVEGLLEVAGWEGMPEKCRPLI